MKVEECRPKKPFLNIFCENDLWLLALFLLWYVFLNFSSWIYLQTQDETQRISIVWILRDPGQYLDILSSVLFLLGLPINDKSSDDFKLINKIYSGIMSYLPLYYPYYPYYPRYRFYYLALHPLSQSNPPSGGPELRLSLPPQEPHPKPLSEGPELRQKSPPRPPSGDPESKPKLQHKMSPLRVPSGDPDLLPSSLPQDLRARLPWGDQELQLKSKLIESQAKTPSGDPELRPNWQLQEWQHSPRSGDLVLRQKFWRKAPSADQESMQNSKPSELEDSITPTSDDHSLII